MKRPKVKMGQIDFTLFAIVMLLVSVGVVMVYSASSYSAFFNPNYNDSMYFLKKQLMWTLLGTIAMIIAIRVDYHKYRKYTNLMMIITFALLVIVLFSKPINGARRWIDLKVVTLQPSELAKYMVVLILARSIDNKGELINSFSKGIIPNLFIGSVFAGMILLEKNLSIASVVMIVTLAMLFAAGAKWRHVIFTLLLMFAAGVGFTLIEPYRMKRLMSFRNPWADPLDTGYQLIQSLYALGSGGILGVGLGKSRQKCYYIPEPHNDFIFSIIAEELGLIGCIFVITLYIIFIWRGILVSLRAKDVYGSILAIGITSIIAIQAVINIAVVSGSMPVTGVPLPFISYGGSSLIFNMFAMGILLNISRQTRNKSDI
ncbi:lipid II flippase FtsW [Clostridium tepidiprofundi DSM 19306]|uniref:Probable peptidoglycan glycosyltransferase FtsW n=1 Tax=Clostridium tepidiprofundi DSM 19306 TaxID=1121338 RepID=A0A151B6V4_9CLOT|nr:stage V sporulation protein E [Clostridium tepidiprofundi]KYH35655.1 lipid II flippase FtsW [Clostridium tepidiprofundi DSM 19306]